MLTVGRTLPQKVGIVKLKLTQRYNYNNEQGAEVEIIDIKRDSIFASGFGVLARLNGRKEPVWLTVDWVVPQTVVRPTKRALDGAKAPRKSKRSTGSPRK